MTEAARHEFQAEVNQVLDIVINSLYSHREIFLRELISNAADALDKLRFRAITEHELLGEDDDLAIRIAVDEEKKTVTISDNGVGMTHDELVENLGTIAHSGSQRFIEAMKEKGKGGDSVELIGQFGVGFYSSFLVAKRVEVTSRAAGADEAWSWTSAADGTFLVEEASREDRGTDVVLHLKDEHDEYASPQRIRHLVERYSDYVSHPIRLRAEGDEEEKWETINQASALWRRAKGDVTDEQYEEFYKHLTHDWEPPLARTHFTIEGSQLFTGLLFVPRNPPFDLYDRDHRRGVRLYVKRVFIMDECEDLIPVWLRFIRGVVDSDDLPLNVSRELLQEDKSVRAIKKNVTKKVLELLASVAKDRPEDYETLWANYGPVLKEGLHFDDGFRDKLAELVRWASSGAELTSLAEYVERMPEDQDAIYYVLGPSRNAVEGSPHAEVLRKRGYEVIYMTDAVDEWAVAGLDEYHGKKLVSAMRADLELDEDEEQVKKREDAGRELEGLTSRIATLLGDQVSEVKVSTRLADSPACLVVPEGGVHAHIERLLRAQRAGADLPPQKRILEVNADHPVIRNLRGLADDEGRAAELGEWVFLLYDQCLLAEGSPIADPPAFARRMSRLMMDAMGGSAEAQ